MVSLDKNVPVFFQYGLFLVEYLKTSTIYLYLGSICILTFIYRGTGYTQFKYMSVVSNLLPSVLIVVN